MMRDFLGYARTLGWGRIGLLFVMGLLLAIFYIFNAMQGRVPGD